MRRLFHELTEALRIARDALLANKSRGSLATLGIVIGIVGVVTTMTAANGISNAFQESVSSIGSDVLYVSRMPWVFTGSFFEFRNRPRVTLDEAAKLERRLAAARAVNPTADTQRSVQRGSTELADVGIIGTTEQHVLVSTAVPEYGRFLTAYDVQNKKRVCVIGSSIREQLFGDETPLHKMIAIGRQRYRVIGVMEQQGSAGLFGGPDFDSQILIPITSFAHSFGGTNRDLNVAVKTPAGLSLEEFRYELVGEMRKIRKLAPGQQDDFSINTMDSLVEMFNSVMGVVLLIGIVITSISLFVGGIGVMNIMFVSVTERTQEIGIRKAIGAKRRAILAQFLLESSAICLVGGSIGLLGAFGITKLIDKMLMPASVSPAIVLIALAVSASVGVVSGFIPALRAARLNPIEALRYE
jgi:putative ABC transport system permease protein